MKTLYLWDGSAFIYRSFFALPPLSTKDGFPTGAIYGFIRAIFALLKSEKPSYFVIAFDHPAPTKREEKYSEYKAKRPKMPDPLKVQIPYIKKLVSLMGINLMELEGYEADDLIGSLALKALDMSFNVKVYTPDKDMLQIVKDDVITVINPMNGEVINEKKVLEKFGVPPHQIPDYLALVGDKVDNVEGVRGVGPKTAIKILKTYGSVENILNNWENFKAQFPQANKESLHLSYSLVKLHPIDIDIKEEDLRMKPFKVEEIKREMERLEFKSLLKELDQVFSIGAQRSLF